MRRAHRGNWVRWTVALYVLAGVAIFIVVLLLMHVLADHGWPYLLASLWGALMPLGTLGVRLSVENPWRRREEVS